MNKRLPLILSLVGVILLAVSLAYWVLQLYQPPQRPLAAVPPSTMPDPPIDAAATLFGGQVAVASATSYQLTGIVADGRDSVAIIVAEGSPPKALRVGKELSPGITLAEVHPRYVMLSDGGVMKRVDLATDAKAAAPMGGPPGNPGENPGMMAAPVAQPMPMPMPQPQAAAPPGTVTGSVPSGPLPPDQAPQPQEAQQEAQQEPPMAPGAVSQQMPGSNQIGPSGQPSQPQNTANNPAPAPVQMPPPTRGTGSPVGQAAPTR
jgi:general secretion pathway protein C